MPAALVVLLFTLPALLAATIGGVVAVRRPPAPKVTAAIQHFAAGIVFAATAFELCWRRPKIEPLLRGVPSEN